jgi:threonine/homoserine/homoserine lactone efflux protein
MRYSGTAPLNWVVGLSPSLAVSCSSRVQIISGVIMIDRAHFLIFLSAAVILAVSPGPGMIYVLARSLRGGRAIGLASCFGAAAGGLVHVVAAGLGLSVILARSASAFLVVKYLGAAYLLYLGIRTLTARDSTLSTATVKQGTGSPFWQGMLIEVLNPKTALFFLALIPQFINHTASLVPQFLALGAISVTLNTMADITVVLAAGRLARRLNSSILWQRRQRLVSGGALVGLGGYVAVS